MRKLCLICIAVLGVIYSCTKDKAERLLTPDEIALKKFCDSLEVSYQNDVLPIINANCAIAGCHAPPNGGNWDYTTYAGLKAKVDNGALQQRAVIERSMPPPGNPPLTEQEVDILKCWIFEGGPNN